MEKQRQTEWENQKLSEMELQREKEQERVLKLKAQNQSLTIDLGSLNDKVCTMTSFLSKQSLITILLYRSRM